MPSRSAPQHKSTTARAKGESTHLTQARSSTGFLNPSPFCSFNNRGQLGPQGRRRDEGERRTKRWPRCPPQAVQTISVRCMPKEESVCWVTAPGCEVARGREGSREVQGV